MPNISTEWRDLLCEQAAYELNNERTYLKVALFWDALNYGGMVSTVGKLLLWLCTALRAAPGL